MINFSKIKNIKAFKVLFSVGCFKSLKLSIFKKREDEPEIGGELI